LRRARERRRVLTEQSTKAARASAEEIAASVGDSSSSSSKASSPSKRGSMSSAAGLDHRRSVDIGGVLGMDIGGTLCKLVYFEKKAPPQEGAAEKWERSHDPFESQVAMKRSISLGDLMETHEQKEALQQFYTFMDTPEHYGRSGVRDEHLAYYSHALGGQLHFFRFETRHMDHAIELISGSTIHNTIKALGCTGGGAFKFEDFFLGKLGVKMLQMDEMSSLVRGLQFCIANVPGECYTFKPKPAKKAKAAATKTGSKANSKVAAAANSSSSSTKNDSTATTSTVQQQQQSSSSSNTSSISSPTAAAATAAATIDDAQDTFRNMRMRQMSEIREKVDYSVKVHKHRSELLQSYPALVVSIGSGVSILKVDGPSKFERVSGSSIGGGTYWGLCRLLTGATSFDDSLDLADLGDSDLVDMLVGDIYGRGYSKFQLSSNTLASSFGKIVSKEDPREGVNNQDIAKALVTMITMNIGQVAYLNAKLYDTRRIYFVGNFLRHNNISARRLSFAIDYWSSGEMEALFFEHEGYLGALGAFLKSGCGDENTTDNDDDNDSNDSSGDVDSDCDNYEADATENGRATNKTSVDTAAASTVLPKQLQAHHDDNRYQQNQAL
jgi:pantothenate kinase